MIERNLQERPSGAVRDTTEGKVNFLAALDGTIVDRYAAHMTKAQDTKGKRNWLLAGDDPETAQDDLDRGFESLGRHFRQFTQGHTDEDHAAAIVFNLDWIANVAAKMTARGQPINWNGHPFQGPYH
jgi:hypothetical protein